ncbi:uncharacterized protein LTHEOB_7316 [Lasiodiplodia theobromae]|uniref:uncharacterized protein n=1 Tax=Lasiodiplodia theobromae TaxID=45133 RepID=UPI0015C334EC|nr:uncharacterized protein LTHEOB_7316 [Lasiodiplodia theobromae]KAF4542586.1 hypothetical protein LTHEOB_7316 [Lasiodiplodia theobromae]
MPRPGGRLGRCRSACGEDRDTQSIQTYECRVKNKRDSGLGIAWNSDETPTPAAVELINYEDDDDDDGSSGDDEGDGGEARSSMRVSLPRRTRRDSLLPADDDDEKDDDDDGAADADDEMDPGRQQKHEQFTRDLIAAEYQASRKPAPAPVDSGGPFEDGPEASFDWHRQGFSRWWRGDDSDSDSDPGTVIRLPPTNRPRLHHHHQQQQHQPRPHPSCAAGTPARVTAMTMRMLMGM